jgi:hypothetical protein
MKLRPDDPPSRRDAVLRQDALSPVATRAESRSRHRHPRKLYRSTVRHLLQYTLLAQGFPPWAGPGAVPAPPGHLYDSSTCARTVNIRIGGDLPTPNLRILQANRQHQQKRDGCGGKSGAKRKPPDHAPERATHEPGQEVGKAGTLTGVRAPRGKTTTGSSRPEASAREAHDPEPKPEKHAEGEGEGTSPAGQDEETNPTRPLPAPEEATAETRVAERAAKRPEKGTAGPPPLHQETEAPAERAEATPETEETEEEAPGAITRAAGQGGETGPNAAKMCSREEAPAASAEERTRASPPTAHPTAMSRPPDNTEPTTPATSAETFAEEGRARDPQKPTIPTKMLTPG